MKISNEFKIILFLFVFSIFIYLIYYLRDILTPVFISLFIAYLLDPVIDKLEKNFSRTFSIFLFIFLVIFLLAIFSIFIIPLMIKEITILSSHFPEYINAFKNYISKFHVFDKIFTENVLNFLKKYSPQILSMLKKAFSYSTNYLSSFINFLLIPVFTFYFLKEFDEIKIKILEKVPPKYREKTVSIFKKIDDSVSSFVRGQLLVATILAILYSIGLLSLKLDLALILGVYSGYANIIPYFGFITGIIFSLLIAVLQYHDLFHILGVIVVFSVVQLLEGFFITPKILGDKIGIHPVTIIVSLMIFGKIFGFIGLIIAVPLASTLKVFYNELMLMYKKSSLWKQ